MLAEVMMLRPHISMGRGRGCRARWFGVVDRIASVFVSFKSRSSDANHIFTSKTQRNVRSAADAKSFGGKST